MPPQGEPRCLPSRSPTPRSEPPTSSSALFPSFSLTDLLISAPGPPLCPLSRSTRSLLPPLWVRPSVGPRPSISLCSVTSYALGCLSHPPGKTQPLSGRDPTTVLEGLHLPGETPLARPHHPERPHSRGSAPPWAFSTRAFGQQRSAVKRTLNEPPRCQVPRLPVGSPRCSIVL